jgi:ribosome biogenesis GTPase / thiamine phosphate phosphatase
VKTVATVVWGANSIYSLRACDGTVYDHIRIKGKILAGTDQEENNPLAPGDMIELDTSTATPRILQRLERKNVIQRWNRKRRRRQVIAANVDTLLLVAAVAAPVYRTGFIDRVLAMAEIEGIPAALVLNKTDLSPTEEMEEHLRILRDLGYQVFRTIAQADCVPPGGADGIEALRAATAGSVTALVGRSGSGKSALINRLVPEADLVTGMISRKHQRGRHTTTLARQVISVDPRSGGAIYIDTPGVREFDMVGYEITEIAGGYREFVPRLRDCPMTGCTHLHEPGCAVRAAVAIGDISALRYDSYRRLAFNIAGDTR